MRSIDLVAYQSNRGGTWFSTSLSSLSETSLTPSISFNVQNSVTANRKNGRISATLVGGYTFNQWDFGNPSQWNISVERMTPWLPTIQALSLKTANYFSDYPNNRALDWWRHSYNIPTDIRGMVRLCNQRGIPIFLELNYSNYVPGPVGTGVESLQSADNIANTLVYLRSLRDEGLQLTGFVFGGEIEDESGFGSLKPTVYNSDLIGIYIAYARAIKTEFPNVKMYAFSSYIAATRARVSQYLDFLNRIRQAELTYGQVLIDGFTFNESYVYMDANGNVRDSQLVVDDTESLYRSTPVYRYDVLGNTNPTQDSAYLVTLVEQTQAILGRTLDIGIFEYLPAIPAQMGEVDTSRYADMDFIIHYSDVAGIYAQLGLDYVFRIMFGADLNFHKAYFDRYGNLGMNYPVHMQIKQYFQGDLLNVSRTIPYDDSKVKVYAARQDTNRYFIMILNKDVSRDITMRIDLPSRVELTIRLPRRSYTSLIVDGTNVTVSGIGN
jgi:hypothetical protein